MAQVAQAAATDTKQEAYLLPARRKYGPLSAQSTRKRKRLFLKAFEQTLQVTKAAEAAGIERKSHYLWLESDRQYAEEFQTLCDRKVDAMEHELLRRGTVGWDEPVFHQGEVCGHIRRFSDACLIFGLKSERPQKYRERYEVTGANGGPLKIQVVYEGSPEDGTTIEVGQQPKQIEAAQQESTGAPENTNVP